MVCRKIKIFCIIIVAGFFANISFAKLEDNLSVQSAKKLSAQYLSIQERPWSVLVYGGSTDARNLGQLIRGEYVNTGETLYSTELAYTLNRTNPVMRFFAPLVSYVQLAVNYAYRIEHGGDPNVNEADLYLMFRWANFPWDKYLTTTFAAGEGVSYASRVPPLEINGISSNDSKKLLDFLVFEVTFALPSRPEWQLVGRIHHRSGAYGMLSNGNAGSNTIGLGLRYYFSI